MSWLILINELIKGVRVQLGDLFIDVVYGAQGFPNGYDLVHFGY